MGLPVLFADPSSGHGEQGFCAVASNIHPYELVSSLREFLRARCFIWLEHPSSVPAFSLGRNFILYPMANFVPAEDSLSPSSVGGPLTRVSPPSEVDLSLRRHSRCIDMSSRDILYLESSHLYPVPCLLLLLWGCNPWCVSFPEGVSSCPQLGASSSLVLGALRWSCRWGPGMMFHLFHPGTWARSD